MFPSDCSRLAYMITLVTDKALAWAVGQEAAKKNLQLRKGQDSVADYAIIFKPWLYNVGGMNRP